MKSCNIAAVLRFFAAAAPLVCASGCARSADDPVVNFGIADGDAGEADMPEMDAAEAAVPVSSAPDAGAAKGEDAEVSGDGDATLSGVDASVSTSADGGSECVAGTYKGAFSGQVSLLPSVLGSIVAVDISGTISISVDTDSAGNLLTVRNGRVEGADKDGNPVTATVNGVLNCGTKKLQDGTLTDGKYVRAAILPVNFTGTVTADYNPNPPSATGMWKTNGGFEGGGGTWSAMLVP